MERFEGRALPGFAGRTYFECDRQEVTDFEQQYALIIAVVVLAGFVWLVFDYAKGRFVSRDEHTSDRADELKAPLKTFLFCWVSLGFVLFFVGIGMPVVGQINVAWIGLELWQIGGLMLLIAYIVGFLLRGVPK